MAVTEIPRPWSSLARRTPALVFAAALVTALPIWWLVATPILTGAPERLARHAGHTPWIYLHAVTGTVMLFSGAAALWIGWTRRLFAFHRWVGATYLLSGAGAAGVALALTLVNVHHSVAQASATGTLAAVWLGAAAMAFRAVRHRRIDSHKAWVIRSYVLTWSFVFCRGLGKVLPMSDAASDAALWMTWIGPLLVCEVALQWSAGAPRAGVAS